MTDVMKIYEIVNLGIIFLLINSGTCMIRLLTFDIFNLLLSAEIDVLLLSLSDKNVKTSI